MSPDIEALAGEVRLAIEKADWRQVDWRPEDYGASPEDAKGAQAYEADSQGWKITLVTFPGGAHGMAARLPHVLNLPPGYELTQLARKRVQEQHPEERV